jgi:hypothetical protein
MEVTAAEAMTIKCNRLYKLNSAAAEAETLSKLAKVKMENRKLTRFILMRENAGISQVPQCMSRPVPNGGQSNH